MLEFFVAEVTARTTSDLLEISRNTAILFYHKICQVIAYNLSLERDEIFDEEIELDNATLMVFVKVSKDEGQVVKELFLVF